MSNLEIQTAEVFWPLVQPARYKGAYGGRGSGKSHFFAELAIDYATWWPSTHNTGLRMVCIREVQKDLTHSAKQLIEDKLHQYGLNEQHGWRILKDRIETPGHGVIIFRGMQDYNAQSIKSLEDFHIAWCEEGQTLSGTSLQLLRPTIRAPHSELWFSWNPRRKQDPVDELFRSGHLPTGAVLVKANWNDNPWFPEVLEQERQDCLNNPDQVDEYDHIWEGGYVTVTKGAYYAKRLAEARRDGRITHITPDPLMVSHLFADIGGTGARADNFVFWVAQFIGTRINYIDYYEAQGQDLATHLAWMRRHGYDTEDSKIWLPHDGRSMDKVFAVSYESAFMDAGYDVEVIPNQGRGAAAARIEAARRLFPSMWFDEKHCEGGLHALGWYHEKINEATGLGMGPDHDWSSHAADAHGLSCIAHGMARQTPKAPQIQFAGWGKK